jgi:hypothetical protein
MVSVPAPLCIFYDYHGHHCVFTAVREMVVPGWVVRLRGVGVEHILVHCRNEFQPVVPHPPNGFYAILWIEAKNTANPNPYTTAPNNNKPPPTPSTVVVPRDKGQRYSVGPSRVDREPS